MWTALITGIGSLVKGWFETKRAKQAAEAEYHLKALTGEQDWDMEAMRQAKYSWKDELITIIWFAPLVVAWFDPERAMKWITFVAELPFWYQVGMFGIMAASFGLRWFFKQQAFKVAKK
ncbi:MAG: hypothetical protein ACPHUL_00120 [Marinomonas gallaica]